MWTNKDLIYLFVGAFGLTLLILQRTKYGGWMTEEYSEEVAICPTCKEEVTTVDWKHHKCSHCGTPLYKKNIEWKEVD